MTTEVNLRELVLEVLLAVTRDQEYSHTVIRGMMDKYQYLGKQERSYLKRVCEGTLEHMIWIDYVINQFSKIKVNKMKPQIRCILRSSVYELKYMDAVPPSATCNEAVKLARKRGFHNLSGFVNGVLRNISRNLGNVSLPDEKRNLLQYLSVKYSVPEWMIEMWQEAYSQEQIESFLGAFLVKPPTSVRVNPLKSTKEELRQELTLEGITVRDNKEVPGALYLENYDFLGKLASFRAGKFYVQDVSSMQVALWAQPKPGDYILDVCAAPGGKSIHLAEMLWQAENQQAEILGKKENQQAEILGKKENQQAAVSGTVEARDLTEYKKMRACQYACRTSGRQDIGRDADRKSGYCCCGLALFRSRRAWQESGHQIQGHYGGLPCVVRVAARNLTYRAAVCKASGNPAIQHLYH